MDKRQFADKVSNPVEFTSQDRGWLKAVFSKYPYSSVLGTLTLLADHAHGFDTPEERRAVALSMCNPSVLDNMVAGATFSNGIVEETPSVKEDVVKDEQPFDILNEINTFQEVSFKTAPKSVILSNFLPEEASEKGDSKGSGSEKRNFNDKKSLTADVSLGTETLAVILKNQGRYDKALAIYRNLLANNPEKSSIFAPRIQELESLIYNSK
jgi:tetratricopeptide (TPR) repeat protein